MVKKLPKIIEDPNLRKIQKKLLDALGVNQLEFEDKGNEIAFRIEEIEYKNTGKLKIEKKGSTPRTYDKWKLIYRSLKKGRYKQSDLNDTRSRKTFLTQVKEVSISAGKDTYEIPAKVLCIKLYCSECGTITELDKEITSSFLKAGIENIVITCESGLHHFRFNSQDETLEEVELRPSLIMRNSQNTLSLHILLKGLGLYHPEIEDKEGNKITFDVIPEYQKRYIWTTKKEAKYDKKIEEKDYTKDFPRYKLLHMKVYCTECDEDQSYYFSIHNLLWKFKLGKTLLACKKGIHEFMFSSKTQQFQKINGRKKGKIPLPKKSTKRIEKNSVTPQNRFPSKSLELKKPVKIQQKKGFQEIISDCVELKYTKQIFLNTIKRIPRLHLNSSKDEEQLFIDILHLSTFLPIKKYYILMNLFRRWSESDSPEFSFTHHFSTRLLRLEKPGKAYPIYTSTQLLRELKKYRSIFLLYFRSIPLLDFYVDKITSIFLRRLSFLTGNKSNNTLNMIIPERLKELRNFTRYQTLLQKNIIPFHLLKELIRISEQEKLKSQRLEHALDIIIGALKDENRKRIAFKLIRGKLSNKGYNHLSEKYRCSYNNDNEETNKKSPLKSCMRRIGVSLRNFNYSRLLRLIANFVGFAVLWGITYLMAAFSSQFFLGMPVRDIFEYYVDIKAVLTVASLGISVILFGVIKILLNLRKLRKLKSLTSSS